MKGNCNETIDEAQRIKNIGIKLKLVIDNIKDVQLVVTRSSSFARQRNRNSKCAVGKHALQGSAFLQRDQKT
ncbi:MAG: hypothetical protein AMS23_05370 [Bacteroides sp. SM1_62]|nr:MAG: hypothetical protein AMS26_19980 [Bacteroides sp. SM23_62]KPL24773.1 MAG: hypothetical protein AMS23_05370 [Bacteroides sp. SM1_62]